MMGRSITIVWVGLVLSAAIGLFLLKYEVIALEDDLAGINRAIEADRQAIHVLRAEWSYLTEPDALGRLTSRHLDLVPVGPGHMTTLAALPFRPVDQGEAPEAPVEAPRVLHREGTEAIPLPGRKPAAAPVAGPATLVTLPMMSAVQNSAVQNSSTLTSSGGWP